MKAKITSLVILETSNAVVPAFPPNANLHVLFFQGSIFSTADSWTREHEARLICVLIFALFFHGKQ